MDLKQYYETNRCRALLTLILVVFTQAATTVDTYLTSSQINAIAKSQFILFLKLLLLQFIFGQICNISYNLANIQNTKQTQRLFHQVRQNLLHHFYRKQKLTVSAMKNNLSNNLQVLEDNYFNNYFNFACDFSYVILTIGALFTFHWLLVIVALLITILAIIVPKFFEKYTNCATQKMAKENDHFLNTLEKWFSGLAELRRFENKYILKRKVGQQSQKVERSEYQHEKSLLVVDSISSIFDIAGRVSVPLIAGILFFQRQISLGAILTAGYFANGIFYSVHNCVRTYVKIKSTKGLREQIKQLQIPVPEKKPVNLNQVEKIRTQKLVINFKQGEEIAYPDFTIKKGEKVLLTGDSGTGKSTLLKVLLGEIKPTSGQVEYLDKKGHVIKPDLAQIGYLAQDLVIFPGTIAENATMFNVKKTKKLCKAVRTMQFETDAAHFTEGMRTEINPEQNLLSGGQKQKVILMRAQLSQKPLLYLDEATSAIDRRATTKILQEITNSPATILLIAHNLDVKQKKLFDRELHLKGARR